MLHKLFVLMDDQPDSLHLLSSCRQLLHCNLPKSIETGFLSFVNGLDYAKSFDKSILNNNQYSYSEIVDKIYENNDVSADILSYNYLTLFEEMDAKPRLYLDSRNVLQQFNIDSAYFDLVVLGRGYILHLLNNHFYENLFKSLVDQSRSPVLIMPDHYSKFNNIVFIYDGSIDSVKAIKSFSYLLSQLFQEVNVIIYTIITQQSIESEKDICSFIKLYKSQFSIKRSYPNECETELTQFLQNMDDVLVVTGVNKRMVIEGITEFKNESLFMQGNKGVFINQS